MKGFYGLPKKDIVTALINMEQAGQLVAWQKGWIMAKDYGLLTENDYEPVKIVLALHRNDPLVRIEEARLKKLYKGKEKGSEVLQYLLIDGEIRGAVLGHFRFGPDDLHEIRIDLPDEEARKRREEIRKAVQEVNGNRENIEKNVKNG